MLSTTSPKTPEPKYTNELDVLIAVAEVEKEMGKRILTEEQRSLVVGGEVKKLSKEEAIQSAFRIVQSMFARVDGCRERYFTKDAWDSMKKEEKFKEREEIFEKIYGVNSEKLGLKIFLSLVRGS